MSVQKWNRKEISQRKMKEKIKKKVTQSNEGKGSKEENQFQEINRAKYAKKSMSVQKWNRKEISQRKMK